MIQDLGLSTLSSVATFFKVKKSWIFVPTKDVERCSDGGQFPTVKFNTISFTKMRKRVSFYYLLIPPSSLNLKGEIH